MTTWTDQSAPSLDDFARLAREAFDAGREIGDALVDGIHPLNITSTPRFVSRPRDVNLRRDPIVKGPCEKQQQE